MSEEEQTSSLPDDKPAEKQDKLASRVTPAVRKAWSRLRVVLGITLLVLVLYFSLAAIAQQYDWMSRGTALIGALGIVMLFTMVSLLVFPGSDETVPEAKTQNETRAQWWVALLLAVYLVVFQAILVHLSIGVWLGPEAGVFPLLSRMADVLGEEKFGFFQDLVLAACAAGLGGAVYMVREF